MQQTYHIPTSMKEILKIVGDKKLTVNVYEFPQDYFPVPDREPEIFASVMVPITREELLLLSRKENIPHD